MRRLIVPKTIEPKWALLQQEAKEAFNADAVNSVMTDQEYIAAYVDDNNPATTASLQAVVDAHNPTAKTTQELQQELIGGLLDRINADPTLTGFMSMTPEELNTYGEGKLANLADPNIKQLILDMLEVIAFLRDAVTTNYVIDLRQD